MKHFVEQLQRFVSEAQDKPRGTPNDGLVEMEPEFRKRIERSIRAIMGSGWILAGKPLFESGKGHLSFVAEYSKDFGYPISERPFDDGMTVRPRTARRHSIMNSVGYVEVSVDVVSYTERDKQKVDVELAFGYPVPGSDYGARIEQGDKGRESTAIWIQRDGPFELKDLWPMLSKAAKNAGGPPEWEELDASMAASPEELYGY